MVQKENKHMFSVKYFAPPKNKINKTGYKYMFKTITYCCRYESVCYEIITHGDIQMHFQVFDMEPSTDCVYDALEVHSIIGKYISIFD